MATFDSEVPVTPDGFNITNYDGNISILNWTGTTLTEVSFEVHSSPDRFSGYSLVKTLPYSISSLTVHPSQNTYYKVRACNSFGCSSFTDPKLATYTPGGGCGGSGEPPRP